MMMTEFRHSVDFLDPLDTNGPSYGSAQAPSSGLVEPSAFERSKSEGQLAAPVDDYYDETISRERRLSPAPPAPVTQSQASLSSRVNGLTTGPPNRFYIPNLEQMNEIDVMNALEDYVDDKCCYAKRPLRRMRVMTINMRYVYHYSLESFIERRETFLRCEPAKRGYPGSTAARTQQPSNQGTNRVLINPWHVEVFAPIPFQKSKYRQEIENTSEIKLCRKCTGAGRIRCENCSATGLRRCMMCYGAGRKDSTTCSYCQGTGNKRCTECVGVGRVQCPECRGRGKLRFYQELAVRWIVNTDSFINNTTLVSDSKVIASDGYEILREQGPRLHPLDDFPDINIIDAMRSALERHRHGDLRHLNGLDGETEDEERSTEATGQRILDQRQVIRAIPIAYVTYEYKGNPGSLYVYGLDRKVYFPNYPARLCQAWKSCVPL